MKGYKLSKDYKKLWNLIHNGYRVHAWILYSDEYKHNIYDLVEVKLPKYSKKYMIGTRGIGYESFTHTFESFKMCCKSIKLRFIVPSN